MEEATETAVLAYATEQPAHGQAKASNELHQRGIFVSPSGVRSIWLRNDLASFKQRLAALTFYVGTIKGVGRMYQQTFVDTSPWLGSTRPGRQSPPLTC